MCVWYAYSWCGHKYIQLCSNFDSNSGIHPHTLHIYMPGDCLACPYIGESPPLPGQPQLPEHFVRMMPPTLTGQRFLSGPYWLEYNRPTGPWLSPVPLSDGDVPLWPHLDPWNLFGNGGIPVPLEVPAHFTNSPMTPWSPPVPSNHQSGAGAPPQTSGHPMNSTVSPIAIPPSPRNNMGGDAGFAPPLTFSGS